MPNQLRFLSHPDPRFQVCFASHGTGGGAQLQSTRRYAHRCTLCSGSHRANVYPDSADRNSTFSETGEGINP